ncbi:APC family permease [Agromyces sp. GXS1127]|uniref:APC family permease n=1 Tax=Agromyces sp. GXS1127 TaxID=3424181 RepID=UPI003D30F012
MSLQSTESAAADPTPGAAASGDPATAGQPGRLAAGRLRVWDIVFFVVSAAAPLTVVASSAPLAFSLGGIGAAGAMLVCGVVLILFAVGFTAMSQHVRNTGAFYAYVGRGLGKPAGVGIAFVTLFAYVALSVSFYGLIGAYTELTVSALLGIDVSWVVWALVFALLIAVLGHRKVDVGAKVLAVLLTAEVGILLLISIAVLVNGGPEPMGAATFEPANILFAGGAGALFVLGFGAFIGFEGTAIYAEEAKDPARTIPKATYIAVAFLAVFYAFTFWILTVAFGEQGILAFAATDDFMSMTFIAADGYLGGWAAVVVEVLIITSFFACLLAFHNASSRYMFSLGREGLLPAIVARTGERSRSPYVASAVIVAVAIVAILVFALAGADPWLELGMWTYAIGVSGVIFAQGVAAVAVVFFFAKDRRGHGWFRVVAAPALGAVGLIGAYLIIVLNFDVVSGLVGVENLPMILPAPALFIAGIVMGLVIKRREPALYGRLAETLPEPDWSAEQPIKLS